jgi:hypothetical protein
MSRRNSRQLRSRASELRRRQSKGLRNMGMAIVVLVALLALGGQFASGAAGCFSSVTENPSAPLQMGGGEQDSEAPSDEPSTRGVRIQVNTAPIPMPAEPDTQP